MLHLPNVETPSLRNLLDAMRKRSKALGKKFRRIAFETATDESLDLPLEKLQISFQQGARTQIQVILWSDRWVWLDARESSKRGWKWSCTFDGRLAGGRSESELLLAVEHFSALLPGDGLAGDIKSASQIWDNMLVKGPRLIAELR